MSIRGIASILMLALTLPGCAAAAGARLQPPASAGAAAPERSLMAEYVQKLPIGSRVRVHLRDGRRVRGTLMAASAERIVIQPRTRIPEPPLQLPLDGVAAVEIDAPNGSVARAIGVGVAAGAAAFLTVMLVLSAIYSD